MKKELKHSDLISEMLYWYSVYTSEDCDEDIAHIMTLRISNERNTVDELTIDRLKPNAITRYGCNRTDRE